MLAAAPVGPAVESLDHEVKFQLPAAAAAPARALLSGICRAEAPHARSRVGTIYFDDGELSSAGEKLASDYAKTKLRLRWYDGGGFAHLEVKRRLGSRREKLRLALEFDGAALERGGLAAAANAPWQAALVAAGVRPPAGFRPALRLAYDRDRFVDPTSGARLSLDAALVALEVAPWTGLSLRSAAVDAALVEFKGTARELPPALRALAALGARRGSFSKYAACLFNGSN
jgi:hypothetical protein